MSTRYKYDPSIGGHAPGHLREWFVEWFEGLEDLPSPAPERLEDTVDEDGKRTLLWLLHQLRKCTDELPGWLYDALNDYFQVNQLGKLRHATYGDAARKLRSALSCESWGQEAVCDNCSHRFICFTNKRPQKPDRAAEVR